MSGSILRKQKMPFTQIPNIAVKKLSLKALGLYVYLISKPDNWSFSAERIAKDLLEDKVDSVKSARKELVNKGFLQMKRKSTGKVEYLLFLSPQVENTLKEEPQVENPQEENPPGGKSTCISNTIGNSNKDSSNKKINKKDSGLDYSFEDFYKLYPNKKGQDKARVAFEKAIDSETFPKTIVELKMCLMPLIVKANFGFPMKFIKHPTTWLNQGCWTDEYSLDEVADELTQDISDFTVKEYKKQEIINFIDEQMR